MTFDKEMQFAEDLASKASTIMKRYFKADDIGTEFKENKTPVTIADIKINQLVIDSVKEAFPDHGVIGEEDSFENDADYNWVVDPIDGTIPFAAGIPCSTFSMALVKRSDGLPVVAITHDPFLDQTYTAVKGQGAFLNGEKIETSKETDISGKFMVVPMATHAEIFSKHNVWIYEFLSAVYGTQRVASGEFIGTVFIFDTPWDVAATKLIVEEAGGIVTDVKGNERRYDKPGDGAIHAANKEIHSKILEILNERD